MFFLCSAAANLDAAAHGNDVGVVLAHTARLETLGEDGRGGAGRATGATSAGTTTVRVVHGVARQTAVETAAAHPADAAGLTVGPDAVQRVGHDADRRERVQRHEADFLGLNADQRVVAPARVRLLEQLGGGTGGTHVLRAVAGLELNARDGGADGDVAQTHRVAGLDLDRVGARGGDAVAGVEALGREDVLHAAVGILHERDVRVAVWVVLKTADDARHVGDHAAKVDETVTATHAAAAVADSDAAVVVATGLAAHRLGQGHERAKGEEERKRQNSKKKTR